MSKEEPGGQQSEGEDVAFYKEWVPKIGGAAFLLCTFIFLSVHERPGSFDSLLYGVRNGVLPALGVTLLASIVLYMLRRKSR